MAKQELRGADGVRLHAWRNPGRSHPVVLDLANGPKGALRGIVRPCEVWVWRAHLLSHEHFTAQTGILGLPVILRPGRLAAYLRGLSRIGGVSRLTLEVSPEPTLDIRKRMATRLLVENGHLNAVLGRRWALLCYE